MRVRDPIHGTIPVADSEVPVLDSRFFQRLRYIKQLGFGEYAFPGATHSRLAHSLGAMHVATRLFDAVFSAAPVGDVDRARFRRAVRLAALCHDLGHLPLSHATESAAPPIETLGLPSWLVGSERGRARHEHFTARILLASSLTPTIARALEGTGLTPDALASLMLELDGDAIPGGSPFVAGGLDYTSVLRQLIGGEIDGDRMDYLLRDSFYTGVNYGHFDLDWIVQNLSSFAEGGRAYLALSRSAVFAFEDYLLSRFHMFSSVYFHHTAVNFDEMLRRYFAEAEGAFVIPSDPEALLTCDDVALQTALRASSNRWAVRIVTRSGYRRICQATERDPEYDIPAIEKALKDEGIDAFRCESLAILSRYGEGKKGPPVFVVDRQVGTSALLADYTPLYRRYGQSLKLSRLYCDRAHEDRARQVVAAMLRPSP